MKAPPAQSLAIQPPQEATVVFFLRTIHRVRHVLLGTKMTEPGKGKLMPPGGKIEFGESPQNGATRESREEVGLYWSGGLYLGHVLFHKRIDKLDIPQFNVHIFTVSFWCGQERDSKNIGDWQWLPLDDLPYHRMMPGDQHWIPQSVLRDTPIVGTVVYNRNNSVVLDADIEDLPYETRSLDLATA